MVMGEDSGIGDEEIESYENQPGILRAAYEFFEGLYLDFCDDKRTSEQLEWGLFRLARDAFQDSVMHDYVSLKTDRDGILKQTEHCKGLAKKRWDIGLKNSAHLYISEATFLEGFLAEMP